MQRNCIYWNEIEAEKKNKHFSLETSNLQRRIKPKITLKGSQGKPFPPRI